MAAPCKERDGPVRFERGLMAGMKENANRLLFRKVYLLEKVIIYMSTSVSGAKKCQVHVPGENPRW